MLQSKFTSIGLVYVTFVLGVAASARAAECDRFVPIKGCRVSVDFRSGVHGDVAVLPNDTVNVVVNHKPPFATCSIAASPSALTRDIGSAFGGFLSTIGTIGEVSGTPKAASNFNVGPKAAPPPNDDARAIEAQYAAIVDREKDTISALKQEAVKYRELQKKVEDLWKSTTEQQVSQNLPDVVKGLEERIAAPEPSIADLRIAIEAVNESMRNFYRRYSGDSSVADWLREMTGKLDDVNGLADTYNDFLKGLLQKRSSFEQALRELRSVNPPYTSQSIPLSGFANKQVSLTLSCKDDITSTPSADNIIFTAFYVKLPILDLSAGVIFSLLGRHQLGAVSQTAAQIAAGTNPNGTFGVTDSTAFQTIPMALVEIHNRGWKCRKYVCTVGLALGAGPNNASGATEAEFFQGMSIAIQRVSLLYGFHDGRFEELGGGFKVGDPLPTPGYSPIINRIWTVHPAFGITYRIPLR